MDSRKRLQRQRRNKKRKWQSFRRRDAEKKRTEPSDSIYWENKLRTSLQLQQEEWRRNEEEKREMYEEERRLMIMRAWDRYDRGDCYPDRSIYDYEFEPEPYHVEILTEDQKIKISSSWPKTLKEFRQYGDLLDDDIYLEAVLHNAHLFLKSKEPSFEENMAIIGEHCPELYVVLSQMIEGLPQDEIDEIQKELRLTDAMCLQIAVEHPEYVELIPDTFWTAENIGKLIRAKPERIQIIPSDTLRRVLNIDDWTEMVLQNSDILDIPITEFDDILGLDISSILRYSVLLPFIIWNTNFCKKLLERGRTMQDIPVQWKNLDVWIYAYSRGFVSITDVPPRFRTQVTEAYGEGKVTAEFFAAIWSIS